MTIVVGITGGIGSGKSTFSKEVLKRGFDILESDKQVDLIYKKPKKHFLNYLEKIGLGKSIKNNKINKGIVRDIVFSNNQTKLALEKFIFNILRKERFKFIKKNRTRKTKIIFFDIPLLFENNLTRDFDIIISIISSKKNRFERLIKSKKDL